MAYNFLQTRLPQDPEWFSSTSYKLSIKYIKYINKSP